MIDPVTGAVIGGAASLAGSYMQNKANEKMAEQAAAQRAQEISMIKDYGQRATESMLPAYQAAQDIRQQGMNQEPSSRRPDFPTYDRCYSDWRLHGAAGAPSRPNGAAVRDSWRSTINYGNLQAQSVPMDYSQLGRFDESSRALDFKPFGQIEYSNAGVMDWDANKAQEISMQQTQTCLSRLPV